MMQASTCSKLSLASADLAPAAETQLSANGTRDRWDQEWRDLGQFHGWQMPRPAPWLFRLWGIRYLRAAVASVRLISKDPLVLSVGCSGYDDWVIYAIARGWC